MSRKNGICQNHIFVYFELSVPEIRRVNLNFITLGETLKGYCTVFNMH